MSVAGMSRAIRSLAVPPALGFEFAVVAIAQQRVVIRIRFDKNASAVPAIAAGRSAARHKFLPPKRHAAISAVAGLHQYFCFVDKHAAYLIPLL